MLNNIRIHIGSFFVFIGLMVMPKHIRDAFGTIIHSANNALEQLQNGQVKVIVKEPKREYDA